MSNTSSVDGEQIPLQFHQYEALTFDQFITGKNGEALNIIKSLALGEEQKPLYLWGASNTGKSHLLQAACKLASDSGRTVAYVPAQLMAENSPGLLEGLENLDLICIDDVHLAEINHSWQEALLHLYNRIQEHAHQLLLSSTDNPMTSNIELADLKSRLSWGLIYRLEALDDENKIQLLKQRASHRGFKLPAEVADFLVKRVDRNLNNLLALLEKMDQHSLSQQRKITIPFVKTLIE